MRDLVSCFSLSPISSFQLKMQFGFHCHRQQQQLWFMPLLGPKTQLSCCDCSCCTFGRNRVTMMHSKWHTLPSIFSSWFPGWSLGFSGKLFEMLSLSLCSLSPSQFITHLFPCFRRLLIFIFLTWKNEFLLYFFSKYFMIYQINKSPYSNLWILDFSQLADISFLALF